MTIFAVSDQVGSERGVQCLMNQVRCRGGCPCQNGQTSNKSERPIDHTVFTNLRPKLAGPARRRFHFVVLDSAAGEAVSIGFPAAITRGVEAKQAHDHEIAAEVEAIASRLLKKNAYSVDAVIAELLECRSYDCLGELNEWALRHMSRHGQPLNDEPSHVERCIAIRAAQMARTDIKGRTFDDVLWVDITNPEGAIRINDYLSDQHHLGFGFMRALDVFNVGRRSNDDDNAGAPPVAANTAPFLASEYLHLWDGYEDKHQFRARLEKERPGMAVLPLQILGQYRAAAVWFYTGDLDSPTNAALKKHISDTSEGIAWMTRLIESAFLDSCVMGLFNTLRAASSGRTLATCERAQNALRDLWFATDVVFSKADQEAAHVSSSRLLGQFGKFPQRDLVVKTPFDPRAVNATGFDTITFHGPLFTPDQEVQAQVVDQVSERLRTISEPVLIAIQLAEQFSEERRRAAISATGHEFANSLSDLTTFSSPQAWSGSGLTAEGRLNIIHRLTHQLSGAAWVMRALSRSKTEEILERLPVARGAPAEHDLAFWRAFLFSRLQYAAHTSWWTLPKSVRDLDPGLRLEFSFATTDRSGTKAWPVERATVNSVFSPVDVEDPRDLRAPAWPLDAKIRTEEHDKLGEYGRIALMMWGGVELMRNATRATVKRVRTEALRHQSLASSMEARTISAAATFECDADGRWTLHVTVDNPLQNEGDTAVAPNEFHSLQQIQDLLTPGKCQFANRSTRKGRAIYSYGLRLY